MSNEDIILEADVKPKNFLFAALCNLYKNLEIKPSTDVVSLDDINSIVPNRRKAAFIGGHGHNEKIGWFKKRHVIRTGENEKRDTIGVIIYVQKKTDAPVLYLDSCYGGTVGKNLGKDARLRDLREDTILFIFSSHLHSTITADGDDIINELSELYNNQGEVNPLEFFADKAVCSAQTMWLCKMTKDNSGKPKLLTVKYSSPKKSKDIRDIPNFLKSGKALTAGGRDRQHRDFLQQVQEKINVKVDSLSPQEHKGYMNHGLMVALSKLKVRRAIDYLDGGADHSAKNSRNQSSLRLVRRGYTVGCESYGWGERARIDELNKKVRSLNDQEFANSESPLSSLIASDMDYRRSSCEPVSPVEKILKERSQLPSEQCDVTLSRY